ncbi:MAG: hypothetical protein EP340_09990 [Alphaproteobacteria bacterium]|nr:MAG: hypothetical protein EP340_09990 [Alphaproteobacteria bacterium]
MAALRNFKKAIALCLAGQLMVTSGMATAAQAEMVATSDVIQKYAGTLDRAYLMSEMERQEVRDLILSLGVDPAEADARLAALSDEELSSILAQYEKDAAGGSSVVGALLTVFLILLATDLLCMTKVFSFTRCVS